MTTHSSAAPPRGSPFILLLAREYRNRPCPDCLGGRQERVVSSISSLDRIPLTAAAVKRQALNTIIARSSACIEVSGALQGAGPAPSADLTRAASRAQQGAVPTSATAAS